MLVAESQTKSGFLNQSERSWSSRANSHRFGPLSIISKGASLLLLPLHIVEMIVPLPVHSSREGAMSMCHRVLSMGCCLLVRAAEIEAFISQREKSGLGELGRVVPRESRD